MGHMLASYYDLALADRWHATFRNMTASQIADACPPSQHLVLYLNFDVELITMARSILPLDSRAALFEKVTAESLRTFKQRYSDVLPPLKEDKLHLYLVCHPSKHPTRFGSDLNLVSFIQISEVSTDQSSSLLMVWTVLYLRYTLQILANLPLLGVS